MYLIHQFSIVYFFFLAVAESVLLYRCTTWTLTKRKGKKVRWELHNNAMCRFEQILEAAPRKTSAVRSTTSHLTNYPRQTVYALSCRGIKDELISHITLWTPTYRGTSVGWPARTYIYKLCADTNCSLENWIELLEIELFDQLTLCIDKMYLKIIYIYIYIYIYRIWH